MKMPKMEKPKIEIKEFYNPVLDEYSCNVWYKGEMIFPSNRYDNPELPREQAEKFVADFKKTNLYDGD